MKESLPELVSFLETLDEPHILFDDGYRILAANAAYRQHFGGEQDVVGRTCYEVSHHFQVPCDQAGESCPLARARDSGHRERVLHLHHTAAGETFVNIELTPLIDAQGRQTAFIEKMEGLDHAHHKAAPQGLIGRSLPFRQMLALVSRVAPSGAAVLLLGETGTGKELVAQAVHAGSERASKPFVPVDCSSLPENLFESELFGHERGAFTGAHGSKPGLVASAHGGTLFLDEVGDIPMPMQVKLLRLLESGLYRRVGSNEQRRADVRIVSATHRDLPRMVREGRFREDLYHRLSTFPIRLPPLRQRAEDLPLLVEALLKRVAPHRRVRLGADALALLRQHPFRGNVRELRNLLERAALLCEEPIIDATVVQNALDMDRSMNPDAPPPPSPLAPTCPAPQEALPLRQWQASYLRERLAYHQGSRAELARELGISERTLYRKLKAAQGLPD